MVDRGSSMRVAEADLSIDRSTSATPRDRQSKACLPVKVEPTRMGLAQRPVPCVISPTPYYSSYALRPAAFTTRLGSLLLCPAQVISHSSCGRTHSACLGLRPIRSGVYAFTRPMTTAACGSSILIKLFYTHTVSACVPV